MKSRLSPQFPFTPLLLIFVCALSFVPLAKGQTLVSVSPASGTEGVPVDSSIVFTFDTPIQTAFFIQSNPNSGFVGSINWSANIDPFLMTPSWSEGNTVLTLTYEENLPGLVEISWEINKDDPFLVIPLQDTSANPIANASGTFTTGEGNNCDPDGVPDSFGVLSFNKFVSYLQESTADPGLDPEASPSFASNILSPAANPVTGASVQRPGGGTTPYTGFVGQFLLFEEFSDVAALDAAWPAGGYTVTMNLTTPPAAVANLNMSSQYPPVPKVANYQATQTVDATSDFELQWNAFAGAAGDDIISVFIQDAQTQQPVFEAPDPCAALDLPNTATGITIPADTLMQNKTYDVFLSFGKTFYYSTNSPAEFQTSGTIVNSTRLQLITTDGVATPAPQLSNFGFDSEGRFTFDVSDLVAGQVYNVQYRTVLGSGIWEDLDIISSITTTTTVIDDAASNSAGARYYRVTK